MPGKLAEDANLTTEAQCAEQCAAPVPAAGLNQTGQKKAEHEQIDQRRTRGIRPN